jgi:hypothetical protein
MDFTIFDTDIVYSLVAPGWQAQVDGAE